MRRTDEGYRTRQERIFVCEYVLSPLRRLNAIADSKTRRGALVRVGDGHADIHPWPELGDAPLEEQIARLALGETTPLTARSLAFAGIDAHFRQRGVSAFDGLEIPASHFPAAENVEVPKEFDTIKIKCGRDFDPRTLGQWRGRRLRLDFNATLTAEEFVRLSAQLPRADIDFVEDPCGYDESVWADLRRETGIRLALDRSAGSGADVLVVKPAVQDLELVLGAAVEDREIVVTSYMDHAFGQACAAWVAAKYAGRLSSRCGLFTHVLFDRDPFFERIVSRGPYLLPPEGTGFGFDDLLHNLPWKALT